MKICTAARSFRVGMGGNTRIKWKWMDQLRLHFGLEVGDMVYRTGGNNGCFRVLCYHAKSDELHFAGNDDRWTSVFKSAKEMFEKGELIKATKRVEMEHTEKVLWMRPASS